MLFVVTQKVHDPVLIAAFLMKHDADEFVKSQLSPDLYDVKEAKDTWKYWVKIREQVPEQTEK